ncbi:hypothetical protein AMTRI_Chr06g172740 [Amborella trichopoda]
MANSDCNSMPEEFSHHRPIPIQTLTHRTCPHHHHHHHHHHHLHLHICHRNRFHSFFHLAPPFCPNSLPDPIPRVLPPPWPTPYPPPSATPLAQSETLADAEPSREELEDGEEEEEEPVFVMTDEWMEFFAKSEAKRRQEKEEKLRKGHGRS